MADGEPLVTILIPLRNGMPYLSLAMESALNQTYNNLEIIVSENYSNDDSLFYIRQVNDSRVKLLIPPRPISMAENWQFAASHSSGRFGMLLGADDILEPNHIEHRVKIHLLRTQSFFLSFSDFIEIDQRGCFVKKHQCPFRGYVNSKELILKMLFGNMNITTAFFERIPEVSPLFDNKFPLFSDWNAWLEYVWRGGGAFFSDQDTVKYRIHPHSATSGTSSYSWHCEHLELIHDFISRNSDVAPSLGTTNKKIMKNLTQNSWLCAQSALRRAKFNYFLKSSRWFLKYHSIWGLPFSFYSFLRSRSS